MATHSSRSEPQPASQHETDQVELLTLNEAIAKHALKSQPAHPAKSEPLRVTLGCMADAIERPQDFLDWIGRYANERAELLALMVAGAKGDDYGDMELTKGLLKKFAGVLVSRKLASSKASALNMHFSDAVELAKTIPDAFDWVAKMVDEERAEKKKAEQVAAEAAVQEAKDKAESLHEQWLAHVKGGEANVATSATATPQPEAEPKVEQVEKPTAKPATVNERMISMMLKKPESKGWTARGWATSLGCAKSTVAGTDAWQQLEQIRAAIRAEKGLSKAKRATGK